MSDPVTSDPFVTASKDLIRRMDRDLIAMFQQDYYPNQRLAYLGLPGPELHDVLCWRHFIGRWTAVQIADTPEHARAADRLVQKALLEEMEGGFEPVRADIDELLSTQEGLERLHWPYQIVNLDYVGGLVHVKDTGGSRRLDSWRAFFARQASVPFLLFITLGLRDNDRGEMARFVKEVEEDLSVVDADGVSECFEAHRAWGKAGLLKIYVPIYLTKMADHHDFVFSAPVLYRGSKQMIHFAARCIPLRGLAGGRTSGARERIRLINLPLHVVHTGEDLRQVELGRIGKKQG